jgi:hypothetical protein
METPGAMPTWAASAQIAMMIIISSNTAVGIWPRHQLDVLSDILHLQVNYCLINLQILEQDKPLDHLKWSSGLSNQQFEIIRRRTF